VRAGTQRYDLIVADNFHPARSGAGSLYTVEHFRAVRARLDEAGLFCQWLPLHQLDLGTLRSIVGSFLAVYPDAFALLANNSLETPVLGLVGRVSTGHLDPEAVRARQADPRVAPLLQPLGLDDDYAVFGSIVAGPAALARFAGDAPLNTDDHPVVTYLAPGITYRPDSLPRDRLVALLRLLSVEPGELFAADVDNAAWQGHLAAYRQARNRFIEIGRSVRPSADPRAMLAQVREPLLGVLRMSPTFRPAYDPLLQLALALARSDPGAARSLLTAMRAAQPARPEADAALNRLDGGR
jgi:spermidine synthase